MITFVLDTVRDRDIIHWLEGQENKSAGIREAIRAHQGCSGITLADVYEAIQDLKRGGWAPGPGVQAPAMAADNEPPDVAAALNSLGL
jgi:hypothetical protein